MRYQIADYIDVILEKGTNDDVRAHDALLDVIHMLTKSWQEVTNKTIRNCFCKAGFATQSYDDDFAPSMLPNGIGEEEFREWVAIDDDLPTSGTLTEEDICAEIMASTEESPEDVGEEDEGDSTPLPPSYAETITALGTLRRAFQFYGDTFELHYMHTRCVTGMLKESKKQTRIGDFFSQKTCL